MARGFPFAKSYRPRGWGRDRGVQSETSAKAKEREEEHKERKVLLAGHARAISPARIGPQRGLHYSRAMPG